MAKDFSTYVLYFLRRCVYNCDNDVVDHQMVNMEFSSGATVNFTMNAFTSDMCRETRICGTMGTYGTRQSGKLNNQSFHFRRTALERAKLQGPQTPRVRDRRGRLRPAGREVGRPAVQDVGPRRRRLLHGQPIREGRVRFCPTQTSAIVYLFSCPQAVANSDRSLVLSDAESALRSHRMVFAAERARREGAILDVVS